MRLRAQLASLTTLERGYVPSTVPSVTTVLENFVGATGNSSAGLPIAARGMER
jgi:hypothetical protein